MKEHVDTELDAVPDVVIEAYIKQDHSMGMTRVRVEGTKYELDQLLNRFNELIRVYRYTNKGF